MKCPNCGTELNDTLRFCTECGTSLEAVRVDAPAPSEPEPAPQPMDPEAPAAPEAPIPQPVIPAAPVVPDPAEPAPIDTTAPIEVAATDPRNMLTTAQYFFLIILFHIPVIGLIFLFVWSLGRPKNVSLKRFSLAMLLIRLICMLLMLAMTVFSLLVMTNVIPNPVSFLTSLL